MRHLHEKLDYLISRQWTRLAEMQLMQLDAMSWRGEEAEAGDVGVRRRAAKGEAAG
ncbi:hypothetical protein [Mesorhizobium sp. YC-39]|uniref:hypothetical protein n=1 Tax=unclassified Mesorhizobium TaxID=325217 RepID=UPI0039930EF2